MLPSKTGKGDSTDIKLEIELNVSAAVACESVVWRYIPNSQKNLRDFDASN